MRQPDWTSDDGRVVLYCGDCLEILPGLGKVDAVVTDPPYGIGACKTGIHGIDCLAKNKDYGPQQWDDQTQDEAIALSVKATRWQVIFGGNYYALPPSSCWLVWDKMNGANNFADCELAWTNLDKAVRRIYWRWHGMIREGREERVHPTQKPLGVMEWCMGHLPPDAETILDPFMGSGTTGVAAVRLGRRFIGIEIDRAYFDTARDRIQREIVSVRNSLPLTFEQPPQQMDLLEAHE